MGVYSPKSGRWAVRIDVDRGADVQRARLALGTFATRKEAERAERDAFAKPGRGIDAIYVHLCDDANRDKANRLNAFLADSVGGLREAVSDA